MYVAQVGTTEVNNNKIRTNGRAEPALLPWDADLHERNCSVTAQRVLSQAGRRPRLTVARRCQWRASSKLPRELYVRSPTNGLDLCQGRSTRQFFGRPRAARLYVLALRCIAHDGRLRCDTSRPHLRLHKERLALLWDDIQPLLGRIWAHVADGLLGRAGAMRRRQYVVQL